MSVCLLVCLFVIHLKSPQLFICLGEFCNAVLMFQICFVEYKYIYIYFTKLCTYIILQVSKSV